MANTVSITFQAEDSAVLRAQKRQQQAEKDLQKEMAATGRAADDAAKKIQGAKAKAAKPTSTNVYGGAHGVSPEVLNPTYWKRQASSVAMVERSLRPRPAATPMMNLAEMSILSESHERITRDMAARKAAAPREAKFLATARLHGIDANDFDGIRFQRFKAAQEIRNRRAAERTASTTTANVPIAGVDPNQNFMTLAGTFAAVGAAALGAVGSLRAIVGVLEKIEAARQGGVERKIESAKTVRNLRQISTSQSHLDSMNRDVSAFRQSFGVDEATAADAIFTMESAGIRNADGFKQLMLAHKSGVDSDLSVRTLASARRNYGYKGDLNELVSKTILAAGPSMANVAQVSGAVGQSAGAWAGIGGDLSSQLAALGILSDSYKSTDIASERVASVAAQLDKRKDNIKWKHGETPLRGLDLVFGLERLGKAGQLRSEGGERVTAEKFLQEFQAIDAWRKLNLNKEDVSNLTQKIRNEKGGPRSTLVTRSGYKIPATDAVDKLVGARQGMRTVEELDAELTAHRDTLMLRRRAAGYADSPTLTSTIGDFGDWAQRMQSPLNADVFESVNIAKFASPEERGAIYSAIAGRQNPNWFGSRMGAIEARIGSGNYSADQVSAFAEEAAITGAVGSSRARGSAAIGAAALGIAAGVGNTDMAAVAAKQVEQNEKQIVELQKFNTNIERLISAMTTRNPPTPNRR